MRSKLLWMVMGLIGLVFALVRPALAAEDVQIALFAMLSGPGVDMGKMSRDGAEMAAEDINASGGIRTLGGAKIKLVVSDVTSNAAQGASVMERTLSSGKISVAVGCGASQMTLACLPVIEKSQVPLLTSSISDKITQQGYKYVFEICPKGSQFGATQVKFLTYLKKKYNLPIKQVGFVYENTAYGTSTAEGLKQTALKEGYKIGLFAGAVSEDAPLHARNDRLHIGIVEAEHGSPVKRHLVDEFSERGLDFGQTGVMVQVLPIDVGDNGERGAEFEEGTVALICLGDQELALSQLGVAAEGVQPAADDDRGIVAPVHQHGGDHRGCGGLSVGSGDGHPIFQPHQLGQHLRSRDYGNLQLLGLHNFDVVRPHR